MAARLYADVVGQDRAVGALQAAAGAPVHAYLLVGPAGSGKRMAARSFAAALLCANGGCGTCRDCQLALGETHPDLLVVEREGPSISAGQAREIVRLAALRPNEGRRKVLVLVDLHLVQQQAPILLKTIEEPPESTVFVVLAEDVPPELVTIASRCVRIDFGPVPVALMVETLVGEGVAPELAGDAADASGGRMDRARLLASDPDFVERRRQWRAVPGRLDGTGAAAAELAAELVAMISTAAVEPLQERHAAELAELDGRVERLGERGSGRGQLLDRQRRELRRLRTDELRFGLAMLQSVYRERLEGGAGTSASRASVEAIRLIHDAAEALLRNPNETLLLQALLARLPVLDDVAAGT